MMKEKAHTNRILIIKTGAVGDVLRTTSFLKGIKEKCAPCKITWLVKANAKILLAGNPYIDTVLVKDKDEGKIKDKDFDLVLSLDDEYRLAELASSLKRKKLMGAYLDGETVTYTDDLKYWFDMSLISRYGKEEADKLKKENTRTYQEIISTALGIRYTRPILKLTDNINNFTENFRLKNNISKTDTVIGLNTGAGKRWQMKKLTEEKTARLAELISKQLSAKIILLGGSEEKERNDKIISLSKTKIINSGYDNSILEFAGIISLCDAIITSDSLALHIATALEKNVVAFFGPTSFAEIDLYGKGEKIYADIPCLTCYKQVCDCNPSCMDLISIEEITKALASLISG